MTISRLAMLALATAACCAPLLAQEQAQERGFEANLGTEFNYDDNIFRQKTDPIGSRVWRVNPSLRYTLQTPGTEATVRYDFSHYNYLDSRNDNYTSHTVDMNVEKRLNEFNTFRLQGSWLSSFEARGVGFNEGTNALLLDAPTPITSKSLTGLYQIGADTARMRMIGSAGARSTDRDSPLIAQDSRDFEEKLYGAQLLYRVGWRTDLVAEYRQRDISYPRTPQAADGSELPLDSTERQYLAGVDLKATAKTTGQLRVGTLERDFVWEPVQWEDGPAPPEAEPPPAPVQGPMDSGQDIYWELAAVWAPRTYSSFNLNSRISTREALAVGSFIRSKEYALLWTHRWNSRFQTEANLSAGTDTYEDSDRQDDRRAMDLRMLYTFDLWLNMGVGIRYQELQTNFANAGFDKWVYYLFINYNQQWGN